MFYELIHINPEHSGALAARHSVLSLIARCMGPTSEADRTQVGPMLAPWTLLSGVKGLYSQHYAFIVGAPLFVHNTLILNVGAYLLNPIPDSRRLITLGHPTTYLCAGLGSLRHLVGLTKFLYNDDNEIHGLPTLHFLSNTVCLKAVMRNLCCITFAVRRWQLWDTVFLGCVTHVFAEVPVPIWCNGICSHHDGVGKVTYIRGFPMLCDLNTYLCSHEHRFRSEKASRNTGNFVFSSRACLV